MHVWKVHHVKFEYKFFKFFSYFLICIFFYQSPSRIFGPKFKNFVKSTLSSPGSFTFKWRNFTLYNSNTFWIFEFTILFQNHKNSCVESSNRNALSSSTFFKFVILFYTDKKNVKFESNFLFKIKNDVKKGTNNSRSSLSKYVLL